LVAAVLILSINEGSSNPYAYGVTFRYTYAADFGLDWKKTYASMLSDLNLSSVRIPVTWDDLEKQKGQYDFSALDYQVSQAESHNTGVILVVGRRVPGWPECHIPDWASKESFDDSQKDLTDETTAVVNRYKYSPALQYWQVENEPFLTRFGICPKYDISKTLDAEIALVRSLDANHQIITTDAGEIDDWVRASLRGDIFGSTLYKKVFADKFHRYITYHIPAIFFRAKKGLVHLFNHDKPIVNIELQGEPWTTKGIKNTSFQEQAITYPSGQLTYNVNFAHQSGFSTTYVWGVEYWYWAASQGHPEFLQEAEKVMSQK